MRTTRFLGIICIFLILFSACSYSGPLTRSLFIEKYNDTSPSEYKMDIETALVHKYDGGNKYYFFYPSSSGGDYMIILSEDSAGEICKAGICIISSIKVEPDIVNSMFCSLLIAFKDLSYSSASSVFNSLSLTDSDTYYLVQNTKKEFDGGSVELVVNDAGCGIYLT